MMMDSQFQNSKLLEKVFFWHFCMLSEFPIVFQIHDECVGHVRRSVPCHIHCEPGGGHDY